MATRKTSKSAYEEVSGDRRVRTPGAGHIDDRQAEQHEFEAERGTLTAPEDQFANFFDEFTQSALPPIPKDPNFHFCWLSTTNQYDPIQRRIRMGYELVKEESLVGLAPYKAQSGEYQGFVVCNEMVLARMPMALYQRVMKHLHHDLPNQEAEKIYAKVEDLKDRVGHSNERPLIEVDPGMQSSGEAKPAPRSFQG